MNQLPSPTGLSTADAQALVGPLNGFLADLHVFYMNLRGFHWNIQGERFFELHLKFEELYTATLIKIDEVAERILTLGSTPLHSFSDYLAHATLSEARDIREGRAAVERVTQDLKTLIHHERELLRKSADTEDEGTNALMSDYLREHEKLAWMLAAYLR